jgi:hypothetical protein
MAEIRVQPRRAVGTWLWVLLALVVAGAVVYYLYFLP